MIEEKNRAIIDLKRAVNKKPPKLIGGLEEKNQRSFIK